MALFYFDVAQGTEVLRDEVGRDFTDLGAAAAYAATPACRADHCNDETLGVVVFVREEDGAITRVVSAPDATNTNKS